MIVLKAILITVAIVLIIGAGSFWYMVETDKEPPI